MQLVFSDQALPSSQVKSVFLAGPSPRRGDELDWRPEFLAELERLGFDGTVYIPIPHNRFQHAGSVTPEFVANFKNKEGWSYDAQVEWECQARELADIIVFWVPRVVDRDKPDLGMPAFTTNFELGEDLATGKVLYGRPAWAVKCSYLDQRVVHAGQTVHAQLDELAHAVVDRLGAGAFRQGGEAQVPLHIWSTPMFQEWYSNLRLAGNRLDGASVLSQQSSETGGLFCFSLRVNVWVAAEQRHKRTEFVISRPNISAVAAVYRQPGSAAIDEAQVVLVREFRSAVNNPQGWVYELPSGSSDDLNTSPAEVAQQELAEETGLHIEELTRFQRVATRQLSATLLTHQAALFVVELTAHEYSQLRAKALADAEASTVVGTGERTYVELASLGGVPSLPLDYAMLGMLFEVRRRLATSALSDHRKAL